MQTLSRRDGLARLGIFPICFNWAAHKKNIGEYIAARKSNHKAFLRKHKLGKFAKGK